MDGASIGVVAAFAAGVVSFLSPCVLPLVPGYLAYVAGGAAPPVSGPAANARARAHALGFSTVFVLGFSTVFVALGAGATAAGRWLLAYRYEANIVGGIVVIVFGLLLTGLVRIPALDRDLRYHASPPGRGPGGAYALGLAFGFGWTPCIGPVLGAILTVSAVSPFVSNATLLLAVYAAGLGVPFVLAALFTGRFVARLRSLRRFGRTLHVAAGIVMILMGVAMITGWLSTFGFWLLETFPVFTRIG